MKNPLKQAKGRLLLGLMLTAGLSQLAAGPINVTSTDFNQSHGPWGFEGDGEAGDNKGQGYGGSGKGGEDNEVEYAAGVNHGQKWDLEAFVMDGTTLYLIGGYDLINGFDGQTSGDLFIKNGGTQPGPGPLPLPSTTQYITNSFNYSYAVDLSNITYTLGSGSLPGVTYYSGTTQAYSLTSSSVVETVTNDAWKANPWKYVNGGPEQSTDVDFTYLAGLTSSQVDSLIGLNLNLIGSSHNVLALDLSSLSFSGAPWLSYTMKCGNDSLKGRGVPDGGASAILLGIGLTALSLVRGRRRHS